MKKNEGTASSRSPSQSKPGQGGRLLPVMTPKDMMSYEPDQDLLDKILGQPIGKEADRNGRDSRHRRT